MIYTYYSTHYTEFWLIVSRTVLLVLYTTIIQIGSTSGEGWENRVCNYPPCGLLLPFYIYTFQCIWKYAGFRDNNFYNNNWPKWLTLLSCLSMLITLFESTFYNHLWYSCLLWISYINRQITIRKRFFFVILS